MKPETRKEIIQERIEELKKEYQRVKKLNESGWEMYGSELCVEEMANKERIILFKIELLEKLLSRPEIEMDSEKLEQKKKQTLDKIRAITEKEQKLSEQKRKAKNDIFLIESIQYL